MSVSFENAGRHDDQDDFFDIAGPREPTWHRVDVTGLFDSSRVAALVAGSVNARLHEELVPEVKTLEDQDWERVWLDRFKPRRYRGDLWVCPSWAAPPEPPAIHIVIDPGLAFGTGDHATTALCLDWISEREWRGRHVLDYGCGSGILAIACLRTGAASALGVDVDPRALVVSTANARMNRMSDRYEALAPGDLLEDLEADLVVANILSSVLLDLNEALTRHTRQGGWLLLAGILEEHAPRVRQAFEGAFDLETELRDGWCLLAGRKR
jgi:ribosomal protein L11 methyltransferase